MVNNKLLDEGYERAIDVLHMNLTPMGFSATPEKHDNYFSIWSRDHSITALAAVLTGDDKLIKAALKGVLFTLEKQSHQGQVPSYVEIENKKKVYGGLGSITSVDSNMWIIIAAAFLYKKTKDKRLISDTNIVRYVKLFSLLRAMDSNDCGLLEVPLAGDWADIFSRSYHVLYDEVLYYRTLKDISYLFNEKMQKEKKVKKKERKKYEGIFYSMPKRMRWIKRRLPAIKKKINESFWLTEDRIDKVFDEYMIVNEIDRKDYNYYQSHLTPFKLYWSHRFDSLGNILAVLFRVSGTKRSSLIINHALEQKMNRPFPLRSLNPPVFEQDGEWEPIYGSRERPYQYHNGGIWPFIGGFWIQALSRNNMKRLALSETENLAKHLKEQGWTFNEYMHGRTGEAMGRKFQTWSAAGYIIAYHTVKSSLKLFD